MAAQQSTIRNVCIIAHVDHGLLAAADPTIDDINIFFVMRRR